MINELRVVVSWVEVHKDFFLVVAALIAAFAAVTVGLISTLWQIHAGALRDYRQRNVEKLREELAAETAYVRQFRFGQHEFGVNHSEVRKMEEDARIRKIRIRFLVRAAVDLWTESVALEEELVNRIKSARDGERWSDEENTKFDREVDRLLTLNLRIVEREMRATVKKE